MRPNRHYPYSFMLSVRNRGTSNPNIRASVTDIQDMIGLFSGYTDQRQTVIVDGTYGRQTRRAVRWYQAYSHLTVDGKVGRQTWRSLASHCSLHH
jgi:peptidoglycan hydrolase-like protein with peptidoglycan-binding domain